MKEIWKCIPNYEGLYEVSNTGRIKSLSGKLIINGKISKEIILKPIIDRYGYLKTTLYKNKTGKIKSIHRVVLEAFVGSSDLPCNHINGIKSDNNLSNLEYCTQSENEKHAHRIGLKNFKGENAPSSKLTESQVRRIKFIAEHYKVERGYWSKLARSLKISRMTIYAIIHNRNWRHI